MFDVLSKARYYARLLTPGVGGLRRALASREHPAAPLSGYELDLHIERQRYKDVAEVHDLPGIFHYWSNKYILPMIVEAGGTPEDHFLAIYAQYLILGARNCGRGTAQFLSIGSGNCDTEVRIARMLETAGVSDFVIECLDLNPDMLKRGRALARQAGMARHLDFLEGDFNKWVPSHAYAGVMATQCLHHVLELEHLFDQIKLALHPNGYFLTNDMIGRNGHQRWPEALCEVQRFWRELPVDYRWNRALNRYEENYLDYDWSTVGFEGVRAQDILPLLIGRFDFRVFIGFANLVHVFLERAFGFNFEEKGAWDRDFVDRVHECDERAIVDGRLSPTQMIAVMTPGPCSEHHYARGLAPARCVRNLEAEHTVDRDAFTITTTSLQRWPDPQGVPPQVLKAEGGVAPYEWCAAGLPSGLEISRSGVVSGRPRCSGFFPVEVTVTDSSPSARTASQRYAIRIGEPLVIISPPALPAGIAGREYRQQMFATGGRPPYKWSMAGDAAANGLALNADTGLISGVPPRAGECTFRVQVTDSSSVVDVVDMKMSIGAPREDSHYAAILSHVAAGDNWNTSIHLLNPFPSSAAVTVALWSDEGRPLVLPLRVCHPGRPSATQTTARLHVAVAPYASLVVETADDSDIHKVGWAEVLSSASIVGKGVFHYRSPDGVESDQAVLLESGGEDSVCLQYDNADGVRTGVAVANLEPLPATVDIVVWDDEWRLVARSRLELPARGHSSFLLSARLPETTDHKGVIQFQTVDGGRIAGLSLLFPSSGRLLTTPRLQPLKHASNNALTTAA